MTGRVVIPKGPEDRQAHGLLWIPFATLAVIQCPSGHRQALNPDDHSITREGLIVPSIVCPIYRWHVHAKLEGWKGV